jgi:hypothetical protein
MIFAKDPIEYLSNYDNWVLACQLIQYVMYVLCQDVGSQVGCLQVW